MFEIKFSRVVTNDFKALKKMKGQKVRETDSEYFKAVKDPNRLVKQNKI